MKRLLISFALCFAFGVLLLSFPIHWAADRAAGWAARRINSLCGGPLG